MAASLQTLADTLGATESECGIIVESLSQAFQSLAARVSEILRLAGLVAGSIDSGEVPSIPAKVESLVGAAQKFVCDRLQASTSVLDVVRNEQELIETLLRINAGSRSIAQEVRMLSVLTGMEVARLGDAGSGFQYLVKELQAASETIGAAAREFAESARTRNLAIHGTQRKMAAALPRLQKQVGEIGIQLQRARADVQAAVQELSACPAEFKACVQALADRISGVVAAIQSHDITRQQNDHVRDAVADLAARLMAGDCALNAGEIALALRVQVLQAENIRQTMDAWIAQIDACLESIFEVSQSRLQRVAPRVFAQEKQLLARLVEIEEIEGECENDGAEVMEAFSGLSGLIALVREHSRVARITRDRLQLLSFNSIIESRNLGGKAEVMLEISRNVTRIASQWGEMAEKSAGTQTEIQRLIDQAHAGMKSLIYEKDHEMRTARLEIVSVLADLTAAAQCNDTNAAGMGELTAALHDQIAAVRSMSGSLRELTAQIGRSIGQLKALQGEIPATEENCNLAALEAEYSQAYTTEIERSILRAALYGGPVPAGAPASTAGNDVELF